MDLKHRARGIINIAATLSNAVPPLQESFLKDIDGKWTDIAAEVIAEYDRRMDAKLKDGTASILLLNASRDEVDRSLARYIVKLAMEDVVASLAANRGRG